MSPLCHKAIDHNPSCCILTPSKPWLLANHRAQKQAQYRLADVGISRTILYFSSLQVWYSIIESHWTQFAAIPETKGGLSSLLRNLTVKIDQFVASGWWVQRHTVLVFDDVDSAGQEALWKVVAAVFPGSRDWINRVWVFGLASFSHPYRQANE